MGGEVVGSEQAGEGIEGRVGAGYKPGASKKHMNLITRYVWAVRACALGKRSIGDS